MFLFWVQEGTHADRTLNTTVHSCEIERETPKTYIVKKPCTGSYGMKVITKSRIGVQFWLTRKDAIKAQRRVILRRLESNPQHKYCLGQLRNLDNLLLEEK